MMFDIWPLTPGEIFLRKYLYDGFSCLTVNWDQPKVPHRTLQDTAGIFGVNCLFYLQSSGKRGLGLIPFLLPEPGCGG